MSSSFDLSIESPVSAEQVFSAFADEDYWHARLASYTAGTGRLESLVTNADGNVTVSTTVSLLRDRLPKLITQLVGGDMKIVWDEAWAVIGPSRARGDIRIAMVRTPISGFGTALVTPAGRGSLLKYTATVEVKVPLVGGKMEKYIGGQLAVPIRRIQGFTTEWIMNHADTDSE